MARRAKSSQDPADLLSQHIEDTRRRGRVPAVLSRRRRQHRCGRFCEQAERGAQRNLRRNVRELETITPSLVKQRFFRRRRRRPGRTMSTEKSLHQRKQVFGKLSGSA